MKKLLSLFAYIFAAATIFIGIATFLVNHQAAAKLVELTGVRVSPSITGGDVVRTISRSGYELKIHQTVFQGLFSDRRNGFVQIDYIGDKIPEVISDDIDYNGDGKNDFKIMYNVKNKDLNFISYNSHARSIAPAIRLKTGYAFRIDLAKE